MPFTDTININSVFKTTEIAADTIGINSETIYSGNESFTSPVQIYNKTYQFETIGSKSQEENYIEGILRSDYINNNNIISGVIIICFLLFTYCYGSSSKFISGIFSEIFKSAPRQNFYQESTLTLLRLKVLMLLVTFILEGMGVFIIVDKYSVGDVVEFNSMLMIASFALICFVVYLIQYLLFRFLGFIFTNKTKIKFLLRGLSSSTILLGIGLIFPVLIAIYYSLSLNSFLMIVIILYLVTRILFIYKGIRIFFKGFNSLIYLILYLCAIEAASFIFYYKMLLGMLNLIEHKLL